jgi:hypothetical protein
MRVIATLVANAETTKAMQPGEGALSHPPIAAEGSLDSTSGRASRGRQAR